MFYFSAKNGLLDKNRVEYKVVLYYNLINEHIDHEVLMAMHLNLNEMKFIG
jgi:hypothetical protein